MEHKYLTDEFWDSFLGGAMIVQGRFQGKPVLTHGNLAKYAFSQGEIHLFTSKRQRKPLARTMCEANIVEDGDKIIIYQPDKPDVILKKLAT